MTTNSAMRLPRRGQSRLTSFAERAVGGEGQLPPEKPKQQRQPKRGDQVNQQSATLNDLSVGAVYTSGSSRQTFIVVAKPKRGGILVKPNTKAGRPFFAPRDLFVQKSSSAPTPIQPKATPFARKRGL